MKRSAIFFSLIIICLGTAAAAFGQKACELNLIGTWKATGPDGADIFYRFGPDARVTALASAGENAREIASAVYHVEDAKGTRVILFKADKTGGGFTAGIGAMEIIEFDETSFTFMGVDSKPTRWVKVDSNQYFIVLAGRRGTFYDSSGPTFPMLIKRVGQQTHIDAVGIYSASGTRSFGPVPADTYNQFMKEPRSDSDVMLRLEITEAQYERGLKIFRTWERRVREGTLLYPDPFLDNILLVKQVVESLNQCSERFKLYKLDWLRDDHISDKNLPSQSTFVFFKEMRRLNESLHIRDEQFYERAPAMQKPAGL